jgi:hypothetical protein
MNTEQVLVDSFHSIELKHSGLTEGGAANEQPADRIRARVQEAATATDIQEMQCSTKYDWDALVLHALLKRYGIKPYRYRKQRRSTILVRVSRKVMHEVVWPIYCDVTAALAARFTTVTTSLLPAIAAGPFSMPILNHEHAVGELCENCSKRILEGA